MSRQPRDVPESERYTEQLNVRFRSHVASYIPRLIKLTGETRQEFFDRLVLQEVADNQELFLEIFQDARTALDQEEADFQRDLAEYQAKPVE